MNDTIFEKKINNLMKKVKNSQMTEEEYRYISEYVKNKNFLVFGTGFDSDLWRYVNNNGKIIFLEHNDKWINGNDVLKVVYSCKITDYEKLLNEYKNEYYDNLIIDIPSSLYDIDWDVILVDSPEGYNNKCIGRMQSIYMAKTLASKNTDIFIHDCDRKVEDLYSSALFSRQVSQLTKLRHVKI